MGEWQVPEFREIRTLGSGGQGRVALALHRESGTPVAIKYLPATADAAARERFHHEARMLGTVVSPHVARLYQLVDGPDGPAIVMEAVDGVPLSTVLETYGRLEPEAALTVLRGSLSGLAAAHGAGVVHRDYKPANVVVPEDGRSKLVDFGIAGWAGARSGAGTMRYMAPEQWEREPVTPATDIYAATCVFVEAITGEPPFAGTSRADVMRGHLAEAPPLDAVPEPFRPMVARGLAKRPRDRPTGAAALVEELTDVARSVYGPRWEERGHHALAACAIGLAALFPLAAAGTAATGAAVGTTAGATAATTTTATAGQGAFVSAGMATGTKAALIVAGTVAAASGGALAVQHLSDPDPPPPPATAASPPGERVSVGEFSIVVPTDWQVEPIRHGHRVRTPGPCLDGDSIRSRRQNGPHFHDGCPGFTVVRATDLYSPPLSAYRPDRPFSPYTDVQHLCPKDATLSGVPGPVEQPTAARRVAVGDRNARYREWNFTCVGPGSPNANAPGAPHFVQRNWYFPGTGLLVFDEWETPGLDAVLRTAEWR